MDIMTKRFSEHTCAVPTRKITNMHFLTTFFDNWIFLSGILSYLLTNGSPLLVIKTFMTLDLFFGATKLASIAYHLQTNFQLELNIRHIMQEYFTTFLSFRKIDKQTYNHLHMRTSRWTYGNRKITVQSDIPEQAAICSSTWQIDQPWNLYAGSRETNMYATSVSKTNGISESRNLKPNVYISMTLQMQFRQEWKTEPTFEVRYRYLQSISS